VLPIEHLFQIVFPSHLRLRGNMFAIHDCYLDDSKDERQELAYVCAGFYGTERSWRAFDTAWRKQLKAEGIDYFKSSECKGLSGQFEKWRNLPFPMGQQSAQLIKERLQKVAIDSVGLTGVGVALPVEEHEAVLKHENANLVFPERFIYHRCFELALLDATQTACETIRDLMVFVHDDGQDFGHLLEIFKDFRKKNPKAGKHLTTLIPMDDTKTPALQLADMFANSVQGMTVKFLMGREAARSSGIFMFDRSSLKVWTRELGEKVLQLNLQSRNIPVPQSLEDAIAEHTGNPQMKWAKRAT
jgi:hypothetical protein